MEQDLQQKLTLAYQKFTKRKARSNLLIDEERKIGDIHINISRQDIDDAALADLFTIAEVAGFAEYRAAFAGGEKVNFSEQRAALHPALRAEEGDELFAVPYQESVKDTRNRMADWVEQLHQGQWLGATGRPIRHLVHIGIGGSYAGVVLVCNALPDYHQQRLTVHFVANVDGQALGQVLALCPPEETLFIVASKSFSTKEVLVNMRSAESWLLQRGIARKLMARHFICITAYFKKAQELGFSASQCLPMPEWVGGRYSLWSAVGFSIAAQIGMKNFNALLAGARTVDTHFFNTAQADNIPLTLALIDIWNINAIGLGTQLVLPYAECLTHLPMYLQQLQMESNGKNVSTSGDLLHHRTSPVVWGGVGTQAQHTFFQLLYQGTEKVAIDWILVRDANPLALINHQHLQTSAAIGHAEAIAGFSTYLVLPELTPSTLGQLLALYEHRIFCQAVLWDVNPFDQFGVEQGKMLADDIHNQTLGGHKLQNQTSRKLLQLAWQQP